MNRNKLTAALTAGALSFCLSFGGVAAMCTGLVLNAELIPLALGCLILAFGCGFGATFRRSGWVFLGISGLIILGSVLLPSIREQWLSLAVTAFEYYDRAYHIGIPEFLEVSRSLEHRLPLLMLAFFICMVTVQTVVRRWPASLSIYLALLPLITCFIVTDTVPELWSLLLWIFGLVVLLLSHPVRQRDSAQGNRLAALLALPVALALGLLLLAIPQEGYEPPDKINSAEELVGWVSSKMPFLGQTSSGELVLSFGGGIADRVNLKNLGKRNMPNTPVMELEADFSGKVYLRGVDMDQYDGLSWTATDDREEDDFCLLDGWAQRRGSLDIRVLGTRAYRYVPYWPKTAKTFDGGQLSNDGYVREYSYDVTHLPVGWQQMWRYNYGTSSSTDSIYLTLPTDTAADAREILAEAGISSSWDTLTIAQKIEEYVENSAVYDLNPDVMPESEKDLAIWFLQEAERGYCVHFATAATVLLRAAGVPARYVEGYTAYVTAGDVTVVRANKAHAWVEYYVSGIGWLTIDPTPSDSTTPSTEGTEGTEGTETVPTETEVTVTEPPATLPTEPSQSTLPSHSTEPLPTDPSGSTETDPTESLTIVLPTATAPAGTTDPSTESTRGEEEDQPPKKQKEPLPGWFWAILIGLATLVALVLTALGQWLLRRWLKLRRMYRGSLNAQALARYREVRRHVRARKIRIPGHLKQLAEKACFSRQGITVGELTRFDAFLRESTAALEKENWVKKLYYRLILAII